MINVRNTRRLAALTALVLVLLAVAKTVGSAMGTGLCFSLSDIAEYQEINGSLIFEAISFAGGIVLQHFLKFMTIVSSKFHSPLKI